MLRKKRFYLCAFVVTSCLSCAAFFAPNVNAATHMTQMSITGTTNIKTSNGNNLTSLNQASKTDGLYSNNVGRLYITDTSFGNVSVGVHEKYYFSFFISAYLPTYATIKPTAVNMFYNGVYRSVNDEVTVTSSCPTVTGTSDHCWITAFHVIELDVVADSTSVPLQTSSSIVLDIETTQAVGAFSLAYAGYFFNSSDDLHDIKQDVDTIATYSQYMSSQISTFYQGVSSQLSTISSALSTSNSRLNTINNSIGSTNNKLDTANNLQEQANQDANDRYEDEKDTISTNVSHGSDAFNNANFSLATPSSALSAFWSLGTSENCVNIPVLAGLLGLSSSTTYCSWFPTSLRSITSPIINIFTLVLGFGFAMSWLKKGGM